VIQPAWLILGATSLGNPALPVMFAFGIVGRRLALGSGIWDLGGGAAGRRGPSALVGASEFFLGLILLWWVHTKGWQQSL
jgi:hypothetical protein